MFFLFFFEVNVIINGFLLMIIYWKFVFNNMDFLMVGFVIFFCDMNSLIFVELCLMNIIVNFSGCIEMVIFIIMGWGNIMGCF